MILSKFKVITAIAIFTTALGLLLSACPQPEAESKSGDASATSITVAGTAVTLPAPNTKWWEAEQGQVTIDSLAATGAAIVVTPTEAGSTSRYAKVAKYDADPIWGTTSTFDLVHNDYIYVEITSPGGNVLYYFFQVKFSNSNFDIKVRVGNNVAQLAAPVSDVWERDEMGKVALTPTQAADPVTVEVQKETDDQKLRFAKSSVGEGTPAFADNPNNESSVDFTFADGDLLLIEVTERTGVYTKIYIIEVIVKNNVATLAFPLQIGTASQAAAGTGNPNVLFGSAGLSSGASPITDRVNISVSDPMTAAQIVATPTADSGATVKYAVSGTEQQTPPEFGATDTFDFGYGSHWLDIQVTAENGITVNYYRYRVTVGASDKTLTDNPITIGTSTMTPGNPDTNPLSATAKDFPVASPQSNVTITGVTPSDTNATIKYARTTTDTAIPVFSDSAALSFPEFGISWLYIQVSAQNGTSTYYRFRVLVGGGATLTGTVSIGSETATPGLPNAAATSATAVPVPIASPGEYAVSATAEAGASVKYGVASTATQAPADYTATLTHAFTTGSTWVYVEVTGENTLVSYYRFQVMIGAGEKEITGATLTQNDTVYTATIGTPADSANVPTADRGAVTIASRTVASTIAVTGLSANASVDWAYTTNTGTPAAYNTNPITFPITGGFRPQDNNNLVIRVTAENGATQFYRMVVGETE